MKKNYFKNLMQVSLLLGAAFVISSCDDVIGQEDNPVASYVQWEAKTPKSIELTLGVAGKETATVKAIAVSSVVIVYESENPEIAKVDPVTGVITAVGVGETNIKAVVTGASSAGQSVFIPEEIKIPVVVKDGKAKLTRVKDEVIEYTANVDSVIDLSKLFTAYPEVGLTDDNSKITYTAFTYNFNSGTNTWSKVPFTSNFNLGTLDNTAGTFEINGDLDATLLAPKSISDTIYVVAEISGATLSPSFTFPETTATDAEKDIVTDTVKIVLNKSIAFINKDGKREILTADKYKTPNFSEALEAGTYYIPAGTATYLGDLAVKGDVTLIFAPGYTGTNAISAASISDQTDKATLNIFSEAVDLPTPTPNKYRAAEVDMNFYTGSGDAISNFAEINLYAGTIRAGSSKENCGAITKVKNVNVLGTAILYAYNYNSGFGIKLLEGGKLTVNGGTVEATATGSDTDNSYAVIGNVEVLKGNFLAISDGYRAVKGSLTAGKGLEFAGSNNPYDTTPTWTKIEGTSSNAKGVKVQAATE